VFNGTNNGASFTLRIEPTVNLGLITTTTTRPPETYKGGNRCYKFSVSDITTVILEGLTQDHKLEILQSDGGTRESLGFIAGGSTAGTYYKSALVIVLLEVMQLRNHFVSVFAPLFP